LPKSPFISEMVRDRPNSYYGSLLVSEMTYTVSSGTLNSTIPYYGSLTGSQKFYDRSLSVPVTLSDLERRNARRHFSGGSSYVHVVWSRPNSAQ